MLHKPVESILESENPHSLPPLAGYVLWLIPAEPARGIYQKQINRLSELFQTPSFLPHLTVGQFTTSSHDQQCSVLNKFSAPDKEVLFPADRIKCCSTPYQNLIHSLNAETVFQVFDPDLEEGLAGFSLKEEFHVSLLYGSVDCADLESETKYLMERLPDPVPFGEGRIIELGKKVQDWKTVQHQQIQLTDRD